MFIVIPHVYPENVKKEDAKELVRTRRKILAFVTFAGAVPSLFFALFLLPIFEDSSYLNSFDLSILSFPSYFFIAYALLGLGLGIYYLASKPDYKTLDEKLKPYKEGEMVPTSKLIGPKEAMILVFYLFFQMPPFLFFIFSSLK